MAERELLPSAVLRLRQPRRLGCRRDATLSRPTCQRASGPLADRLGATRSRLGRPGVSSNRPPETVPAVDPRQLLYSTLLYSSSTARASTAPLQHAPLQLLYNTRRARVVPASLGAGTGRPAGNHIRGQSTQRGPEDTKPGLPAAACTTRRGRVPARRRPGGSESSLRRLRWRPSQSPGPGGAGPSGQPSRRATAR